MPASAGPLGKQETMIRPRPDLGLLAAGLLLALPLGSARAASPAPPQAQPLPAAAPAATAAPSGAGLATPLVSGLGWRSGGRDGDCLVQLRGRRLDVTHSFLHHNTFPEMVRYSGAGFVRALARKSPLWVVSVGLVTDDHARQFDQCAAGAFDGYFRQVGANLRNAGAQGTVVRLGWEANSGTHAWGLSSSSQVPAYKACFRRAAQALKAGGPGLLIEWTNAKKGKLPALSMYPGDDVVDLWGVHYYDTGPKKSTQAIWDQYVNATNDGNPWGIGAWLRAAQAHGKRLGVAEWAIWDQGEGAKADDPVYMDNMARFFRANAGSIAYETYFNTGGIHSLCPSTRFPKAAARYKADWGG
jgi:hypothetical protein